MVIGEMNNMLNAVPSTKVVKKVVFEWNGKRASGPDGFIGLLHQSC